MTMRPTSSNLFLSSFQGTFLVVKLLRAAPGSIGSNIDVEYLGFFGQMLESKSVPRAEQATKQNEEILQTVGSVSRLRLHGTTSTCNPLPAMHTLLYPLRTMPPLKLASTKGFFMAASTAGIASTAAKSDSRPPTATHVLRTRLKLPDDHSNLSDTTLRLVLPGLRITSPQGQAALLGACVRVHKHASAWQSHTGVDEAASLCSAVPEEAYAMAAKLLSQLAHPSTPPYLRRRLLQQLMCLCRTTPQWVRVLLERQAPPSDRDQLLADVEAALQQHVVEERSPLAATEAFSAFSALWHSLPVHHAGLSRSQLTELLCSLWDEGCTSHIPIATFQGMLALCKLLSLTVTRRTASTVLERLVQTLVGLLMTLAETEGPAAVASALVRPQLALSAFAPQAFVVEPSLASADQLEKAMYDRSGGNSSAATPADAFQSVRFTVAANSLLTHTPPSPCKFLLPAGVSWLTLELPQPLSGLRLGVGLQLLPSSSYYPTSQPTKILLRVLAWRDQHAGSSAELVFAKVSEEEKS